MMASPSGAIAISKSRPTLFALLSTVVILKEVQAMFVHLAKKRSLAARPVYATTGKPSEPIAIAPYVPTLPLASIVVTLCSRTAERVLNSVEPVTVCPLPVSDILFPFATKPPIPALFSKLPIIFTDVCSVSVSFLSIRRLLSNCAPVFPSVRV